MRLLFNRSAVFYMEYNVRLFFYLLFSRADIFLSNDTDTLPANYCVALLRKKALVFDAHEMFPEVPELVGRPLIKAIWESIEAWIFPHLKHCYTVCSSISDIYRRRYGIQMEVVRNISAASRHTAATQPVERFVPEGKKILFYQGAVNVGRGLEWIIDAMPWLDECVFCIAGDGDVLLSLQKKTLEMGLSERVKFLGRIALEELHDYTSLADVGINLLDNKGLNYYYSLPNRIFDFMRAGVPVLASDFPEIRKIVHRYGTGVLVDHYEPEYLAGVIKQILATPPDKPAFEKACRELTWENEAEKLVGIFEGIG
jgi:glycosyltransferase involved in cell wall biosynthesis